MNCILTCLYKVDLDYLLFIININYIPIKISQHYPSNDLEKVEEYLIIKLTKDC